jgi:hypothetical protein
MDIEVKITFLEGREIEYDVCRFIQAIDKSMWIKYHYTSDRILETVYQYKDNSLTGIEYHYNEDGLFEACCHHVKNYVLRRDEDNVLRLEFPYAI